MKLASLKSGRDGKLVVVSGDLTKYADASSVAPTMQAALDDWARCEPLLRKLSPSEPFSEETCAAPLPRGGRRADVDASRPEARTHSSLHTGGVVDHHR